MIDVMCLNALTWIISINTRLMKMQTVKSSKNVVRCDLIAMMYTIEFAKSVIIIQIAYLIIDRNLLSTIYEIKQ